MYDARGVRGGGQRGVGVAQLHEYHAAHRVPREVLGAGHTGGAAKATAEITAPASSMVQRPPMWIPPSPFPLPACLLLLRTRVVSCSHGIMSVLSQCRCLSQR